MLIDGFVCAYVMIIYNNYKKKKNEINLINLDKGEKQIRQEINKCRCVSSQIK